ncbi:hypothetical protein RHGRI_015266 [Rhododendron griersonianum]|uniref:Aminotransferase-like plant mobile domain-containing protein n=1 Tax=Rhododendron griersonianum TaxID=479676 RepID=A0AAV6KCP4_9ERIC|nr:hypothetical protein RHGRI_015266 [Rhododendron griersonianum]KAG5550246.1 hypothetical protein RHGRI_015266 [Rhododendron griersonianum]
MDGSSIDPGPTDGSLLVLQKQHCSRAVWEGYGDSKVENVTLICRRNDNNLRQLGRPSPRIVELIYQASFGGILEMSFITLDRVFITALIERWRPETHTFHLRSGESTVTLQDVEIITGLLVDGRLVTGDSRFDKVEEGDDKVTVLRKARGYILQLIGGIVLPDQSSSHVHLYFLSLLDDLQLAVPKEVFGWQVSHSSSSLMLSSTNQSGCCVNLEGDKPPLPSKSLGEFHGMDLRNGVKDWSKSIRLWNDRANNIVNITDPDILVYPADDPYLDWYERITLRFVSKMGAATNTTMQLFERLSMPFASAEVVQAMAQRGVECLKFQEKLFRKIAPEHKIRDPQIHEEFDEDYDHMDPHLQAEAGVHQQNQPVSQHQPEGPPEDTHAEYQFEEPIATSSSGGPVHPSEISTPFSSAILNMDGVSMSPLLNYSPTAGVGGSQSQTPSDFDWANMQISTVGGGETISECSSRRHQKRRGEKRRRRKLTWKVEVMLLQMGRIGVRVSLGLRVVVFFSKEEVQNTVKKYSMQQNTVVMTSASSPTMLVYKCKNPVP